MEPGPRTILRACAALALLVFAAPAALPHVHAGAAHDAEICAGHLGHDRAPDVEHGGSCLRCPGSRRDRVSDRTPAPPVVAPTAMPVLPWSEPLARLPGAEPRTGPSPRGPPFVSFAV